ncbi:MAG: hypothetical protein M3Q82_00080, partial [Actinomycetota bacterium]|nr:hypothetical protein [Actinomycetota bacterium]
TGAGVSIEGVPARTSEADERDVLIDRRGEYTYCVDVSEGNGTASDPLIALAGMQGADIQQTWATVYDKPINQPVGSEVLLISGFEEPPPPPATDTFSPVTIHSVYGTAGPDVSGVDIALVDGTTVTATVHDGTWAAWWPDTLDDPSVATLQVHTGSGIRTVDPSTVTLNWDD